MTRPLARKIPTVRRVEPCARDGQAAPETSFPNPAYVSGAAGSRIVVSLPRAVGALLRSICAHEGQVDAGAAVSALALRRAREIGLVDPASGTMMPDDEPVSSWGPRAADESRAPETVCTSQAVSGAGYSLLTVRLSERDILLMRLVGAHEGVEDESALISKLVVERAAEIGIARLADVITCAAPLERKGVPSGALPLPQVSELQGRAAAARLAHNQEVTGSSPVPATSSVSERARVSDREGRPPVALPAPPGPP